MTLHREQIERETKFALIAKKAQENPQEVFTSLSHYLSEEFLINSYRKLRRPAVAGLDGKTYYDYELNLSVKIEDLHKRLRSGEYKAPDIKRAWIDKGDGKKRPLGISTVEDKIVQRAVTDILNNIYEQDFYDFSFGFRKKHSAHQALKQVHTGCMNRRINWIIDADVLGCFDNFDHQILRDLLSKRLKDKWILRLIDQWLKVGIVDGNSMHRNQEGTPQGNIISPLLCNVYLHYVLDEWMMQMVKPLLKGEFFIIRYADDFMIGFELQEDAQRVMKALPKRMAKYGLTVHPEKTKLVEFRPDSKSKPLTIDFLGFTHYWSKSRKGVPVIKRRTTCKGLRKGIKKLEDSCRNNRHERLKKQFEQLRSKLHGLYQYYGIRCNSKAINTFYQVAIKRWYYWLNRRSQTNSYTWKGFKELLQHFILPKPRIRHNYV